MFIAYRLPENLTGMGAEIARADTVDGAIKAAGDLYSAQGWQLIHAELDAANDGCADMCFAKIGTLMMTIVSVEPIARAAKHARLVEEA